MGHQNGEHKLLKQRDKINMLAELDAFDVRVKIPLLLNCWKNFENFWVEG